MTNIAPVTGLLNAQKDLYDVASNIATGSASNSDQLAGNIVKLQSISHSFEANIVSLNASNNLSKQLLDIYA